MTLDEFSAVLTAFADRPVSIDAEGRLVMSLQDSTIEATVTIRSDGQLMVEENGTTTPALSWLRIRIAKLEFLARQIEALLVPDAYFVEPSGLFEGGYERHGLTEDERAVPDIPVETIEYLRNRPADASCVLYFTSGAGEGKSTLIRQLAIRQAREFLAKRTDWLIVPVELGGKLFMRLDDIVVGNMANRFRFNFLYYESFMALVRLGFIVPALDGFEEMFVAGSAERSANSALGTFVRDMQGRGGVIVAARTAYYEFQDMQSKATVFDTTREVPANFGRIQITTWDENKFVHCGKLLGIADPERIYRQLANRFGPSHPILVRPVLARRMLTNAKNLNAAEFEALITSIGKDKQQFIHDFYRSLLTREAESVWVYQDDNKAMKPMLDVGEHFRLLAAIAQEMWTASTEWLRADTLVQLTELYVDDFGKNARVKQQATKRIKDHAFLTSAGGTQFAFVHVDAYHFFLAQALGTALRRNDVDDCRRLFRHGLIPADALEYAAMSLNGDAAFVTRLIAFVSGLLRDERGASFAKENLGTLVAHLFDHPAMKDQKLESLVFPQGALKGRTLEDMRFSECQFQQTSLERSKLTNCRFHRCRFEGLEDLRPQVGQYSILSDCQIEYASMNSNRRVYRPEQVKDLLTTAGFRDESEIQPEVVARSEDDEELILFDRLLTILMRTTHVTTNRLQQKYGARYHAFRQNVLPQLLQAGVMKSVPYTGGGQQEKFALKKSMDTISKGIEHANGKFTSFLAWIKASDGP